MTPSKFQLARAVARAAAAAAIVATMALGATSAIASNHASPARVETHIKDMHAKLQVTAAQEVQWARVADVMRENATKMVELNSARAANAKTMNAVDDLKSYGEVVNAHADEIKRFAAAFEPLYASMSDPQKAAADTLFRHGRGGHKSRSKSNK